MTQITSIKLGLIGICIATVSLSLAQTLRTGTSGSNPTGATIRTTVGHSGLSSKLHQSPFKLGQISGVVTSTGPNANVGVHIGINAGAQSGISNSTGITGAAAGGLGNSSGYVDSGYTDWDKSSGWHDYDGEHECRSTHCCRRACQGHYYSAPTRPGAI